MADLYPICALTGEGIEELKRGVTDAIVQGGLTREYGELVPVNLRHKRVLERTKTVLGEVVAGCGRGIPWDLTAIEMRRSLDILGEIAGETTSEEILQGIFSRFCIGK